MKKSNLDEMQEQKLLKIEHNGYWLAFWGLVASITIQGLMGGYLDHIMGEVAVLMLICFYMLFGCLKHGIWDRRLKPNLKNNLLCSLAASLFMGVFTYIRLADQLPQTMYLLASCLIAMAFVFVLCLIVLGLCSAVYKMRRSKLDKE